MPAPLRALQQALLRRPGGDRVMAQVLAAVPTAGLDAVLVAAELVLETGAVSAEHVLNVIGRLNASPPPDQVETVLRLNEAPRADTDRYDRLRDQADIHCLTFDPVSKFLACVSDKGTIHIFAIKSEVVLAAMQSEKAA